MKKLNIDDINHIIKLLEDPNPKIYELIKPQLQNSLNDFSEHFKNMINKSDNYLVKHRLKDIVDCFYFDNIENLFRNIPLENNGDIDLEYASFLLSTFEYPELDKDLYKDILDKITEKIKSQIENITDPLILIDKINDCIFKEEGFSGNQIDYTDPNNTYINMVIDRRTGIPITLSAVYLFIAKRLNLDFFGVGMPGHFILKYKKDNFEIFIDPFYSGHLLSKQDCINFLNFSGYGFIEEYLEISSNKEIFKRMIRNLLLIYKEEQDETKYNKLRDLFNIVDINY